MNTMYMRRRDAFKMVVPKFFNPHKQTYHGHLNKSDFYDFQKFTGIEIPKSSFQVFVSTGEDMIDGEFKISITSISYDRHDSENVTTIVDPYFESQLNKWFDRR